MASGWHNERVRHSLAARGLTRQKKYYADAAQNAFFDFANPVDSLVDEQSRQEDQTDRVSGVSQGLTERVGGRGTAQPQSISNRIGGRRLLDKATDEFIRSERQFDQAISAANRGDISQTLSILATGKIEDGGVVRNVTSAEVDALKTQINLHAVRLASSGTVVPDGLNQYLDKGVQKRISLIEENTARSLESPFKTTLRDVERKLAVGAVDKVSALPGVAADTAITGTGAIVRAGFEKTSNDFPGIVENIDALEKQPFIANNAAIGNGDNSSGFDKIPRISSSFDFIEDKGPATNPIFNEIDSKKTFSENVQEKVDSLYGNRDSFAKTDAKAFSTGNAAFEKGDRENLISSIAELQSQEAVLKDKWNFVSQTHAQVMSNQNHESAFDNSDSSLGVLFNAGGARRLSDQAEKLNDVRGELVKSNNKISGRRIMLENKLQRMDAVVPAETSTPKKEVKVFNTGNSVFNDINNVVLNE